MGSDRKAADFAILLCTLDRALRRRWNGFRKQYADVQKKSDEEAVHNVRTTTRRLLAVLQLVCTVNRRKIYRQMRKNIKAVVDHYSPLRDTHVQMDTLEAVPALDGPVAEAYRATLEESVPELERRTFKSLPKVDFKHCRRTIRKFSKKVAQARKKNKGCKGAGGDHNASAMALAEDLFAEFDARRRLSLEQATPQTLHRARLAFKKFRYSMEILRGILPETTGFYMDSLPKLQDAMGGVQDLTVLRRNLEQFCGKRDDLDGDDGIKAVDTAVREHLTEALSLIATLALPWTHGQDRGTDETTDRQGEDE